MYCKRHIERVYFYENLLISGLFFRIFSPAFYLIFLLFVLLNFLTTCVGRYSAKLLIIYLFFKFACLFFQNNLASLHRTSLFYFYQHSPKFRFWG